MKKKIKDLTFFNVNEVCQKHNKCAECPLALDLWGYKRCIINMMYFGNSREWPEIIEQEVDI